MKWLQDLIRFLKKNATREGSPQGTLLKTFWKPDMAVVFLHHLVDIMRAHQSINTLIQDIPLHL